MTRVVITGVLSSLLVGFGALPAADAASWQDPPIPPIGGGSPQPKPSTQPEERDDAKLLRLHNSERSRHQLRTFTTDASLTSFARRRAAEMAKKESVWHSRNLPTGERWYIVGENVARATTIEEVFEAFLNSRAHRANVFRPAFRAIGIGVAESAGAKYVDVVYGQPWPAPATAAALPSLAAPWSPGAPAPATQGVPPARAVPTETQSVTVLVRLVALEQ
jgi:hypothetical protein